MRTLSPVLVASLLSLVGCASAPAAPPATPALPPATVASTTAPSAAAPPAPPPAPAPTESPAHRQLMWVVDAMAHAPNQGDIVAHFSPLFLSQVPASTVVSVFKQVMPGAPYTLGAVTPAASGLASGLSTTARSAKGPELSIDIDVDADGLIRGLLIKPKAAH